MLFRSYACMEALKGNAIYNMHKSLEIVSKYPKQVIVLKGRRIIDKLRFSSRGLQKRFEDPIQTKEFRVICQNVKRAVEGDAQLSNQILIAAKVATGHFESFRKYIEMLDKVVYDLSLTFQRKQLKDFRKKDALSQDIIDKIIEDIIKITAYFFNNLQNIGDINTVPSVASLPNSYIFRYAICLYLLVLRWMSDGGVDRKSTRLNSSHIPLSRMPSSA